MMVSAMNETVNLLLALCNQPYLKAALVLVKAAKIFTEFIEGDSVQAAVRIVTKSNMEAVNTAIAEMPKKNDKRSAVERISDLLTQNYFIFKEHYDLIPKSMKVRIPGLWQFNEFRRSKQGVAEIEDTIARICFLKAICYKILGDDPSLVKEWLCEKEFPCDEYEILAQLLGQDAAMEYIASNPEVGSRIAGQYLAERSVSLEDYQTI